MVQRRPVAGWRMGMVPLLRFQINSEMEGRVPDEPKLVAIKGGINQGGFAPLSPCARHGADLGGASPLWTLMMGTTSRWQLRRREAGWEGSRRRNSEPTKGNRIRGRCGEGNPAGDGDARRSSGHTHRSIRRRPGERAVSYPGRSPVLSGSSGVGARRRALTAREASAEAIVALVSG
jgi:hypothetical protein